MSPWIVFKWTFSLIALQQGEHEGYRKFQGNPANNYLVSDSSGGSPSLKYLKMWEEFTLRAVLTAIAIYLKNNQISKFSHKSVWLLQVNVDTLIMLINKLIVYRLVSENIDNVTDSMNDGAS